MARFSYAIALGIFLVVSGVGADDSNEAKKAFETGAALFQAGKYDEAAISFRKANDLKPHWRILYNIGQSEAAAKRYGLALEAFEAYLAQGGDDIPRDRQQQVLAEVKRLREMVGSVDVKAPDGAVVTIDGTERGKTPLLSSILVSAGVKHNMIVHLGRENLLEKTFIVRGGVTLQVEVVGPEAANPVVEVAAPEAAKPVEGRDPNEEDEPDELKGVPEGATLEDDTAPRSLNITGWITLGFGVAATIGGIVTGGLAVSQEDELKSDCPDGVCPDGYDFSAEKKRDRYATATDVLLPTGIVLAAAGAALLIVDAVKSKREKPETAATILPVISPDNAGLVLRGSF